MSQKFKGEVEVQTGLGLPRHTTTSRNAYTPSAKGYKVFDTNLNKEFVWTGSAWAEGALSSDYVDLTSAQSIAGNKTFTDIPVFAHTSYLIWNMSLNTDGAQGISFSSPTNGYNGYISYDDSNDAMTIANAQGGSSKITINTDKIAFGKWVELPNMVASPDGNAATTVDYVNNKISSDLTGYVKLTTNQTIGGHKTFTGKIVAEYSTNPLIINQTTTNSLVGIEFQNAGDTKVRMGASATSFSLEGIGMTGKFCGLRIYSNDVRLAFDGNEFQVGDDFAMLTKGHLILQEPYTSTDSRSLVPKSYVDSKFVTLNTTQLIGGTKTFSNDITIVGNDPTLIVNSTVNNYGDDAIIELKTRDSGGTDRLTGKIYVDSSANALKIDKYNRANGTTLNNQLAMYDTYSQFTDEVRGVTGSNAASFVTRSFVTAAVDGIVTDHGGLTGLGDDDHSQYHTDARGDARYYTKSQTNSLVNAKEDSFSKNTAFNKNFGTTSGTVTQGNDSRLSNARTPTAHTHTKSDITDFGSYVDLTTTQSIGGSKTFTNDLNLTTGTPYLDINATSGNGHLRFQESGTQRGIIYWDRNNDRMVTRTYADNGSTVAAEIVLDDTGWISSSVEHRGVDSTTASSFTTRGYVDGKFVPDTGNTSISGTKTFNSSVIVPDPSANNHALNRSYADARYVQNTGNETISGTKTFNGNVIVPNSTTSNHALNVATGDGRYVQDTGNSTIAGNKTFSGYTKLAIAQIDGYITSSDNFHIFTGTDIVLNADYNGSAPSQTAEFRVNRGGGSEGDAFLRFNEASNAWEYGIENGTNGTGGYTNEFASRAYADTKISQSGGWMYGDLGFRLPNAALTEQQNGIFFREHGDNSGANFGGCFGKQFAGGGKRMYLAHMLGSTLNSFIRVDEENIAVEPTSDFYVYRGGELFNYTGVVNSGSTHKLTMKTPDVAAGTTELAFETRVGTGGSGVRREVRIASNSGLTSSYTMLLPVNPPTAGQVLTCQSLTGQIATLEWA